MRWFQSAPSAHVQAEGEYRLIVIEENRSPRIIALPDLDWISFVNIGDSFFANEDGWWLLGKADSALGIWVDCPTVDTIMRNQLAAAADAVGDLTILHLATSPPVLSRARKRGGIIQLGGGELESIRGSGTVETVETVQAFPSLP